MPKNQPKAVCICGHKEDEHAGTKDAYGACSRCGCQEFLDIRDHNSKMDRRW